MTVPLPSDVSAAPVEPTRRRSSSSALTTLAAGWLLLVIVLAVLADVLPLAPYDQRTGAPRLAPGARWPEFLGTDELGRSVLSRVIHGARISLTVGLIAVTVGILVGGLLGLVAGFYRGRTEKLIGLLVDTMLAFPPLVLLLAITAILTQSFVTLTIGLSILTVPSFARLARANTLSLAQREFVLAARSIGAKDRRILLREIIPNAILPMSSYAFLLVAAVVVAEGSLSFLGLGIPPPRPSWGGMIASGRTSLSVDPWLTFTPAIVLFLTVVALNVVGDRARRRFDTKGSSL